jgi:abhydrolase domain-containing protein 17
VIRYTVLAFLLSYASLACIGWFWSDRMIFLPPRSTYTARDLPVRLVPAEENRREVAVLYLENPASTFTLLFSHGNGEDLGHLHPFLRELASYGFSVLAFDYRGYGLSSGGPPGELATYKDIEAVHEYATRVLGIAPHRLLVHGRSVGTGPSLHLATSRPVGGLILESGFTSAFRVMTRVPLLPFDKFPNLERIRTLDVPVLVMHGRRDRVIPFRMGAQLFDAAPEPKQRLWVETAGHNDLAWVAGERYAEALRSFAALVAGTPQSSRSRSLLPN